jgi:hypothetical protein
MLRHCFCIATSIALAVQPACALRVEARPDPLPPGYVETYFTGMIMVDGLPVFQEGLRMWSGERWIPLPSTHSGERPIPRRQRRLE